MLRVCRMITSSGPLTSWSDVKGPEVLTLLVFRGGRSSPTGPDRPRRLLPCLVPGHPGGRSGVLARFARPLEDRAEEIAQLESRRAGKPIRLTREFDVPGTIDTVGVFIGAARDLRCCGPTTWVVVPAQSIQVGTVCRHHFRQHRARQTASAFWLFDDSATEKPNTDAHVIGGNWKVLVNRSVANNGYCIAGRDGSQHVSGVGMAVGSADRVLISANTITRHHPVVPARAGSRRFPSRGDYLQEDVIPTTR